MNCRICGLPVNAEAEWRAGECMFPGSPACRERQRAADAEPDWRSRALSAESALAAEREGRERAEEQLREPSAATDALDAIAKLCECPGWEYPGQVVRDVEALAKDRDGMAATAEDERHARERADAEVARLTAEVERLKGRRYEVCPECDGAGRHHDGMGYETGRGCVDLFRPCESCGPASSPECGSGVREVEP